MRACLFAAVAATAACSDSGFSSDVALSGSYHYSYAPPDGDAVSIDMAPSVFDGPALPGACCLSVFRRGHSLTIHVGTWLTTPTYPDPTLGCPALASADIVALVADGTQTIDAATAHAVVTYDHAMLDPAAPATQCPRSADVAGAQQLPEPIGLAGQIKLDALTCAGGESADGDCALQATGSWAIEGSDQITGAAVLFTSGAFVADDQRVY